MGRWSRFLLMSAAAAGIVAMTSAPAAAHAVLDSAEPADGATLNAAPSEVVLSFTEPIDAKVSSIRVLDTNGRNVSAGEAQTLPVDAKRFRIVLTDADKGVYIVTWRVLSRVDGHVTGGSLAFGVGVSPEGAERPAESVEETPGATPWSVGGRLLFYVGIVLLLGAACMSVLAFDAMARLSGLMWGAWVSALAGSILLAESQREETGAALGDIFGTSIGYALLWRIAPLAVVGAALAMARGARRNRRLLLVVAIASVAAVVGHVAFGHASAGGMRWLKVAAQSAHFAAIGVWIGGLVALLIGIRRTEPETRARAVRRFSAAAGVALAVVIGTGTLRAVNETGSWRALTTTTFGRIVIAKVALLVALAVLGAINRYRHVRRANETVDGLRRISRVEVGIAVAVLALTGMMASIAPARTAAKARQTAAPAAIVVSGADYGTTTRARLEIAPGKPGPNRFALQLTDYDTGAPITARRVALTFSYRGRSDVQPSTVELERQADGSYASRGGHVGLGGPWKVTILVERESTSVEIPLYFATLSDQKISELLTPGQPTLYDVALGGTGSVQFYVDPPKAGPAEVHATFFDPSGAELGGLQDITLVASAPDGSEPLSLPVRLLTPGHFVADAELTQGRWRFDVTASTKAGDLVWGYFIEMITP